MQVITIKKEGFFFSFWDEETASWIERNITESALPFSWYLPYSVQINSDVTTLDIVKNLEPYKSEIEIIFANALGGISLAEFYEILNSPFDRATDLPINCTYLFKIGKVSPANDENFDFLSVYPVMMGLIMEGSEVGDTAYHLSSYDVRSWCKLPVGLDLYIEYADSEEDDVVFDGLIQWMFFEIIHTIISQMSLCMQVTKVAQVKEENILASGPIEIDELFNWLNELDNILLYNTV